MPASPPVVVVVSRAAGCWGEDLVREYTSRRCRAIRPLRYSAIILWTRPRPLRRSVWRDGGGCKKKSLHCAAGTLTGTVSS
jgi:hypothetical protein